MDEQVNAVDHYDYSAPRPTLLERVEKLERAVDALGKHVGGTGWYPDIQRALDDVRQQWLMTQMRRFHEGPDAAQG